MIYSKRFTIVKNEELDGWDIIDRKFKFGTNDKVLVTFYHYDMALQYLCDLESKRLYSKFMDSNDWALYKKDI